MQQQTVILKLAGIDDRSAAEGMQRARSVFITEADLCQSFRRGRYLHSGSDRTFWQSTSRTAAALGMES